MENPGAISLAFTVVKQLWMTEQPFRPREKLVEKQKYFQSIHKHTYLKGPLDRITSVAIPLALAATTTFMIARGIYNMSHGIVQPSSIILTASQSSLFLILLLSSSAICLPAFCHH
ncbi:hypothetical protein SAY86_020632 [Trapa natans]|uniref:Uncharacterized protein n=1 Tax=Trapa natans TaxID=22666 RepID=A0AAN7LJB3_TRANT|nr:hypothetical protein SAY86_020632 [Trapa natans]